MYPVYYLILGDCLVDDGARLLANGRPKCNSILHLFGPWLFEAALINCNLQASPGSQHSMYHLLPRIMINVYYYVL